MRELNDNPIFLKLCKDIKKQINNEIFYRNEKNCLFLIEKPENYLSKLIEYDMLNIIKTINENKLFKKNSGINPLSYCIIFNKLDCFIYFYNKQKIKLDDLKLLKLCLILDRPLIFEYIIESIIDNITNKNINELILLCIKEYNLNCLKLFDKKLLKKNHLYLSLINFKNNDNYNKKKELIYYLLDLDLKLDKLLFKYLENINDNEIIIKFIIKYEYLIDENIIKSCKKKELYEIIKLYDVGHISLSWKKFRDKNKKDNNYLINFFKNDEPYYIKNKLNENINLILIFKYDSVRCFFYLIKNNLLKIENKIKIFNLLLKYDSLRCLRVFLKFTEIKEINLRKILIEGSFEFLKLLIELNLIKLDISYFNSLEVIIKESERDVIKKIKIFKNQIKEVNKNTNKCLLWICNRELKKDKKNEIIDYILKLDSNKNIDDNDGNTYEHLLMKSGSDYLEKLEFYSKENKNGKIPIELLVDKIKKEKNLENLKKLIEIYEKLKKPFILREKFIENK